MTTNEFPTSVIEHLGYYVYTLIDPRTETVFYVGKGKGERVFAHVKGEIDNPSETATINLIRKIREEGHALKNEVMRHGMTETEAFEVESALIDYIRLPNLTNIASGIHMEERGRMSVEEVIARYSAKPITIQENAILIKVSRSYEWNINPQDLYDTTRGDWILGPRRKKAKYAFSIYKGVVREVYRINAWGPIENPNRAQKGRPKWRFEGEIARDLQHYVGGSVETYQKPGAQFPIKYVNCD